MGVDLVSLREVWDFQKASGLANNTLDSLFLKNVEKILELLGMSNET